MFERILVPLDGSIRAEIILDQILRLARRGDVEVVLLRVVDPLVPAYGGYDFQALLAAERLDAQQYLETQAKRLTKQGMTKVHVQIADGTPAEQILEAVRNSGATLLALATHGRRGLARWAMGSVAERVVRACEVPVFLTRSFRPGPRAPFWEPAPAEDQPVRKILVPTDGSEAARAAIGPAEKLALLFGAEVVVLHVVTPAPMPGALLPGMEVPWTPMSPPALPASDKDEATRATAERFAHAGLKTTRLTVMGDPAAEIVDHPALDGIDLIAMATHGRTGASRWLLGSVTERVLRHAKVPLLLVRANPEETKPAREKAERQAAAQ